VFFGGNLKNMQAVKLEKIISKRLTEAINDYDKVTEINLDMKQSVLQNLVSDDNNGQLISLLANEISQKIEFFDICKDINNGNTEPR